MHSRGSRAVVTPVVVTAVSFQVTTVSRDALLCISPLNTQPCLCGRTGAGFMIFLVTCWELTVRHLKDLVAVQEVQVH